MNDDDVDAKVTGMLVEYAGPIVRDFLHSKEATYRNLNERDPKIRFAALSVIDIKWGVTEQIVHLCEELARNDSDAKVRGVAVICLSGYYRKTGHPRIIKLLATISSSESESLEVRKAAYSGLFSLLEPDPLKWPLAPDFRFPNDVDWAFLNACLDADGR
jgi:hypothetical protein